HVQVSLILWLRTGGRVTYLAELCRTIVWGVFGEVGEDGTWRLRLNEFAHILKLASKVPEKIGEALRRRLDTLPYTARQVVLRAVCVAAVGGRGGVDLLLHLLTHVVPFKQARGKAVSAVCPYGTGGAETNAAPLPPCLFFRPRLDGSASPFRGNPLATVTPAVAAISSCHPATCCLAVVNSHDVFGNNPSSGGSGGDGGGGGGQRKGSLAVQGLDYSFAQRRASAPCLALPEAVSAAAATRAAAVGWEAGRREGKAGVTHDLGEGWGGRGGGGGGDRGMNARWRDEKEAAAAAAAAAVQRRDGPESMEALCSCLTMLEAGGFLRVEEGGQSFVCDDLMLLDKVYASMPFKLRKALHREAAAWLSARHRSSFQDRAQVMPVLIHHLTQAHQEGRAQAMLAVLKV
ncbi:unnamed protein product, partial [Discosporangium mesarthrocarpum]